MLLILKICFIWSVLSLFIWQLCGFIILQNHNRRFGFKTCMFMAFPPLINGFLTAILYMAFGPFAFILEEDRNLDT